MIKKISWFPKRPILDKRTFFILLFVLSLFGIRIGSPGLLSNVSMESTGGDDLGWFPEKFELKDHSVFRNVYAESTTCDDLGWFPEEFGLKDHSVFIYDGYYYIVSINYPIEEYFAYARSTDLCHWEDLSPVLSKGTGVWDDLAIWAPQVLVDNEIYYMFYTGIKGSYPNLTQSIMLATTTDPSDPSSWIVEGMVFQPDHPDMLWSDGSWADCRDPMVFKVEENYYMYYTGRDIDGGIVGIATARFPEGPWRDYGSIMTVDGPGMTESPTIWQAHGGYYLFYNLASTSLPNGEMYRFGPTPAGPWGKELPFTPGWAHEIWTGMDEQTYTSYLIDYSVTIQPLSWNTQFIPPHPSIGQEIENLFLPMVVR